MIISSTYLFQKSGATGGLSNISFSKYYIVNSAMTVEIGDPIGIPEVCL